MRSLLLALVVLVSPALADESPPRLGGHVGLALPLLSIDNDGTTAIGRDFVQLGISPGITVKLTGKWSVDFEFIAFSRWEFGHGGAPDKARTIVVIDPGVLYNFGPVVAGLRVAVQVGETVPLNFGLVPILVVPFKISRKLSYFLELDLPVFILAKGGTAATTLAAATGDRVLGNFNVLFQTGFAF